MGSPLNFNMSSICDAIQTVEIKCLLQGIYEYYGHDFRNYAAGSIRRRIVHHMQTEGFESVSSLMERVLRDRSSMERLLRGLTLHVTAMFRDPEFYLVFRRKVVPFLRTYPFTRLWVVGCSTGEEVYSLAIVMKEEGLYDKCRIYATDLSDVVIQRASEGVFPLSAMKTYTENYLKAGGTAEFSSYYTAKYENAIFRSALRENIVFAQHNLTSDGSFNEFNVIFCRNVMIYFNTTLQHQVCNLLHESLARFGILALGSRESLRFTPHEASYDVIDEQWRTYRRER